MSTFTLLACISLLCPYCVGHVTKFGEGRSFVNNVMLYSSVCETSRVYCRIKSSRLTLRPARLDRGYGCVARGDEVIVRRDWLVRVVFESRPTVMPRPIRFPVSWRRRDWPTYSSSGNVAPILCLDSAHWRGGQVRGHAVSGDSIRLLFSCPIFFRSRSGHYAAIMCGHDIYTYIYIYIYIYILITIKVSKMTKVTSQLGTLQKKKYRDWGKEEEKN